MNKLYCYWEKDELTKGITGKQVDDEEYEEEG